METKKISIRAVAQTATARIFIIFLFCFMILNNNKILAKTLIADTDDLMIEEILQYAYDVQEALNSTYNLEERQALIEQIIENVNIDSLGLDIRLRLGVTAGIDYTEELICIPALDMENQRLRLIFFPIRDESTTEYHYLYLWQYNTNQGYVIQPRTYNTSMSMAATTTYEFRIKNTGEYTETTSSTNYLNSIYPKEKILPTKDSNIIDVPGIVGFNAMPYFIGEGFESNTMKNYYLSNYINTSESSGDGDSGGDTESGDSIVSGDYGEVLGDINNGIGNINNNTEDIKNFIERRSRF